MLRGDKRNMILGQAPLFLSENSAWLNGGIYHLQLEAPEVNIIYILIYYLLITLTIIYLLL